MKAEQKNEMCQCRKCDKVFNQNDVETIHNKIFGIKVVSKISPCCENGNFGLIRFVEKHTIEGVYKTKNYFKK